MIRKSRKKRSDPEKESNVARMSFLQLEAYGALLTLFSFVLFLSLVTFDRGDIGVGIGPLAETLNLLGPVGAYMANLFLYMIGLSAYLVDVTFAVIGIRAVICRPVRLTMGPVIWGLVAVFMSVVLLHVGFGEHRPFDHLAGGITGLYLGEVMIALFSRSGATLLSAAVLVIAGAYLSGNSFGSLLISTSRLVIKSLVRIWRAAIALIATFLRSFQRAFQRPDPDLEADEKPDEHDTRVELRRGLRPFRFEDQKDDQEDLEPAWVRSDFSDSKTPPSEDHLSVKPPSVGAKDDGIPVTEVRSTKVNNKGPKIVVNARKPPRVQGSLPLVEGDGPSTYEAPSISLLDFVESKASPINRDDLRRNAETLEKKLKDFKVDGRVVEIHPGPVVTMYEFLPSPGIKISQIANLSDDLTMALSAMSIRIVAPIPGKGVVGIEVPNDVRETVYLREILASEAFDKSRSKLTLALGKDIFGNPVVTDLSKMPHLLVAGATGSGKSVAVNAFLMSLMYNSTPEEVRIILVDPKVVELQVYEGVPHLLLPVVYDPKHAAAAMRWAVEEMERRYELLARFGTRNIVSYNRRVSRLIDKKTDGRDSMEPDTAVSPDSGTATDGADVLRKLPYLVIVLDEFADLMMVASKDVESAVARLAQKARAAGIHLVMATQRPSKEVITGLIKANFTSRISFRVSSRIDSRIILDQGGAESLLGYGDMLYLKPGSSILTRVHGPFVSEEEVRRVVRHLKTQGEPEYDMDILQSGIDEDDSNMEDVDPLLGDAVEIIMESRRASISYLQRRLKVGYNRAARIMEQVEHKGIVGPPDSRGERQVIA